MSVLADSKLDSPASGKAGNVGGDGDPKENLASRDEEEASKGKVGDEKEDKMEPQARALDSRLEQLQERLPSLLV